MMSDDDNEMTIVLVVSHREAADIICMIYSNEFVFYYLTGCSGLFLQQTVTVHSWYMYIRLASCGYCVGSTLLNI